MLKILDILASYLKIVHVIVISTICIELSSPSPNIHAEKFILELGLTIISILIGKKHFLDVFQIIFSLNLSYTLIPNNYSFLAGLFFFKIIYVFNVLGEAHEALFSSPRNILWKYLSYIFAIVRLSITQYLFLGLMILGYKLFTFGDPEGQVPEDYIILYQLIVTASTIGYGDITPKTHLQIYYFTFMIPIICGSFVIYLNALIPTLSDFLDFILGKTVTEAESGGESSIIPAVSSSKLWSTTEKQDFQHFVQEVASRQAEHDEHHKRVGHNWIALSATHYERQIPLITVILRGDEGKEIRLKVSSKVRRQYYPRNWVIIQAGDRSEDLMMVDQGEVRIPESKGAGFVFNKDGFIGRSGSPITVTAASFVTVWAISMKDIEDLAKTSGKLQTLLQQGININ